MDGRKMELNGDKSGKMDYGRFVRILKDDGNGFSAASRDAVLARVERRKKILGRARFAFAASVSAAAVSAFIFITVESVLWQPVGEDRMARIQPGVTGKMQPGVTRTYLPQNGEQLKDEYADYERYRDILKSICDEKD